MTKEHKANSKTISEDVRKTVTFGEAATIVHNAIMCVDGELLEKYHAAGYETAFVNKEKDISSSEVLKERIREVSETIQNIAKAGKLLPVVDEAIWDTNFYSLANGALEVQKPNILQTAKNFVGGKDGSDNLDNSGAIHIRTMGVAASKLFNPSKPK